MSPVVDLPGVNLQPGELHLTRQPAILQTILGSCVGVTFWSRRLGAGALCHGVLPKCPTGWAIGSDLSEGSRYVDYSIRYLAWQFDRLGAKRQEVEVKLFGGADVLPASEAVNPKPTVGMQNCKVALQVLEEEGFIVRASDLGGVRGRTIHFHTGTGDVFVRRLGDWSDPDIHDDFRSRSRRRSSR
jgi:chemotaxis protein CheD